MQQALDFVKLRLRQLNIDLEVYREQGPAYAHEEARVVAIIGELEGIATAIETFMAVNS